MPGATESPDVSPVCASSQGALPVSTLESTDAPKVFLRSRVESSGPNPAEHWVALGPRTHLTCSFPALLHRSQPL